MSTKYLQMLKENQVVTLKGWENWDDLTCSDV